jgi:hypothetical protein
MYARQRPWYRPWSALAAMSLSLVMACQVSHAWAESHLENDVLRGAGTGDAHEGSPVPHRHDSAGDDVACDAGFTKPAPAKSACPWAAGAKLAVTQFLPAAAAVFPLLPPRYSARWYLAGRSLVSQRVLIRI